MSRQPTPWDRIRTTATRLHDTRMPVMKKILCADIGTSSLKSAVIDEEGRVLASARVGFAKYGDDFASREWITALKSALDEIFKAGSSENDQESSIIIGTIDAVDSINAICISGNGPTIVAENGRTLLWNAPADKKVA